MEPERGKAMKKNDNGMGELLELLKSRPGLISALVFDPVSIKRLLRSKAARRLIKGVDTRAFLRYVAGSADGGPIALCLLRTALLCPKGTRLHPLRRCPKGSAHPTTPCGPFTRS
jgi:hypothetical protein